MNSYRLGSGLGFRDQVLEFRFQGLGFRELGKSESWEVEKEKCGKEFSMFYYVLEQK
jgi:hypothetical protein